MRKWFEPLPFVRTKADCDVMNRAVRNMYPVGKQPAHKDLVEVALTYKRGMTAADLMDAIEDKQPA